MILKNGSYTVKNILSKNPVPHNSEYRMEDGSLKKGAQRKWCKKMVRKEGVKIVKMRAIREKLRLIKERREQNVKTK